MQYKLGTNAVAFRVARYVTGCYALLCFLPIRVYLERRNTLCRLPVSRIQRDFEKVRSPHVKVCCFCQILTRIGRCDKTPFYIYLIFYYGHINSIQRILFTQKTEIKFKEGSSEMLHLDHGFVQRCKLDTQESRSELR